MRESFDKFIDTDLTVFSVGVKQSSNDNDILEENISLPNGWNKFTKSVMNYADKKNGLAMATGKANKIVVININDAQQWKKLLKENEEDEPDTIKVKTATGGVHLYFKYSDKLKDLTTISQSFCRKHKISVKTNEDYVLLPPTSYEDKKSKKKLSYKWEKSIFDKDYEIEELPKWLLKKLTQTDDKVKEKKSSDVRIKRTDSAVIKQKSNNKSETKKPSSKTKSTTAKSNNSSKEKPKEKPKEKNKHNNKRKNETVKVLKKSTKIGEILKEIKSSQECEDLDSTAEESENDNQSNDNNNDYNGDEIKRLLELLSSDRVNNNTDRLKVGMAIHNSNEERFHIWEEWCKTAKNYDSAECKKNWKSFKKNNSEKNITIGTIIYWCGQDSPDKYKEFKIKRKSDKMILEKYPGLGLELGKTIDVLGKKCTFIDNDFCVFINGPHKRGSNSMYVEVRDGVMELRCRHEKCTGKVSPCPPIRLTRNEMNIMNHGTINVTINNYTSPDEQLIEFQKYDIFENEIVNELVYKSLNGNGTQIHTSFADIIYYYYKDLHNVGEDNNWYSYQKHRWNLIGAQDEYFAKDIEKKLISMYEKLVDYGKGIGMDNIKIKEFEKIIRSFKNVQVKANIVTATKELFKVNNNPDRNFVQKLNTNNDLIVFTNGVYDLKTFEFRDGSPHDNISIGMNYAYADKHTKYYAELMSFLEDIQPNKEDRDFLLTYLSHALCGNTLHWFTVFIGEGRNGKTNLIELLSLTFGDYYEPVKSQMFTRPRPAAGTPEPELLNLRNKKLVISSEADKKSQLNSGFIKFMTGKDSMKLRFCHGNEMLVFTPKFITIFSCNTIPDTDEMDIAFSKRLKCVHFPTIFCEDPIGENQKLIDLEISNKFDNWKADFMLLLIEYYKKYSQTKKITITDNVLKWTNQYKEGTDTYLTFVNECTENSNKHVRTSHLYEAFKKWFKTNNPDVRIPTNKEFTTNLKKHKNIERIRFDTSSVNGIKNLKLIDEYVD
jgi:P4 family phage/plasmid primase-like protien